ncbi:SH3 domain-containing protein [Azospirillum sp. sgz302134]
MSRTAKVFGRALLGVGMAAMLALPAAASPGDIHTVTGEKVNLRAAPSDDASIRSTVGRGDEVIELKQEGNWLGVRSLRTGEEGWVFADLVKRRTPSTLSGAVAPSEAGFGRISSGFDNLLANINSQLGYRFAERVEQTANGGLRVIPTQEWLYNTSREAKIYAALALYEMWKNHNNGRPVNVALGSPNASAIGIEDTNRGPELAFPMMGASR